MPVSSPEFPDELLDHLADVRAWCLQRSGDPHLADDVMQETVLAALKGWGSLREPERLRGWLFRIAQRRLADAARVRRGLPLTEEPLARPPGDGPDPELVKLAYRAVRKLPLKLRRPVRLHYLKGKPLREVARTLGTSLNSIKARLYRARRMMRQEAQR